MLRVIVLALAYLTCTSCEHEVHRTRQLMYSSSQKQHQNVQNGGMAGKLKPLAMLLVSFNAGTGSFSRSMSKNPVVTPVSSVGRTEVLMQLKLDTASATPGAIIKDKRGALDLLDEDAMHKAADFSLTPQECVDKAQAFIAANYGQGDVSLLADDFQFIGPFVGPLDRPSYVEAMEGALNPQDGFPDLCGRQFGFTVDPVERGRVWWFTRPTGTFQKDWFGATADGSRIETAPQSMGVLLNEMGQVSKFNMGTPIDRTSGNSGGLGGLFAFMYFVGKPLPIPECQPYEKSFPFQILSKIGEVATSLKRAGN